MAVFPESRTRRPQYGYDNTPDENVKRTPPYAGNSFQRDGWGVKRFVARMDFLVTRRDAAILWRFYEVQNLVGFTFFDFETEMPMKTLTIGTGDGSNLTFTIPAKETANHVIKVANGAGGWTTMLAGTHYNISYGTGSQGEDQVIFTPGNAPASGRQVTTDADGRRRYTVEFAEKPSRRSVGNDRVLMTIKVQERFPLAA